MIITRALPAGVDLLALQSQAPERFPALFESSAHGTPQGRWDLLLAGNGEALALGADGVTRDERGDAVEDDFLHALDRVFDALRSVRDEPRWPFRGGWALFLTYELARQVEPVLSLPEAVGALPVAVAMRCPAALLRDHLSGECIALAEVGHETLLDELVRCAERSVKEEVRAPGWESPEALDETPAEAFERGVEAVLEYLRAGDVFQVNLSRGWEARFASPVSAAAVFRRLREHNPAPFAGVFCGGGWAVASASPERLVSVRGEVVQTRPIAGTRPRLPGDDEVERVRELVGHPKERAEHVMLIDLERNDLGRVCVAGSVEVDELMTVESYAHVHHIVSNVRGRLREGTSPGDIVRAIFPGGTITGCPKVRCMQIIAELEGQGRGAYTGAMGWLNRDGDLDLNILIRSAQIEDRSLRFRTGAGIVADSDPRKELEETRAKARGMLRALGVAG